MGPWIFATAVFLVAVFLALRFPRYFGYAALACAAVVIVAGYLIYLDNERSSKSYRDKLKISKSLISASNLEISDLQMNLSNGYGQINGTILNKSSHVLDSVTLLVTVRDCKEPWQKNCNTIGQNAGTAYGLNVPSMQKRAFSLGVSFSNFPTVKEWGWQYSISEISAEID